MSVGSRHLHQIPGTPDSRGSSSSTMISMATTTTAAAAAPWPPLRKRDTRAALLVLREFLQGLLTGIEDSCYRIYTETEMTILFDETLFGHISGPPELLLTTPNDPEMDALPHSPHLPPSPPNDAAAEEDFLLRFSRTQSFSTFLQNTLQRAV